MFDKIYKDVVDVKNTKIFINFEKFNNINQEIKVMVLKKAIRDFNKSYYSARTKKVINLINRIEESGNTKLTLGGCVILREKKHIILRKESKN